MAGNNFKSVVSVFEKKYQLIKHQSHYICK